MKYQVVITEEAEKDIVDIWSYIALNDCLENADYVVNGLEKTIKSLETLPHKGHIPVELERVFVFNCLEVHFKPYRIIYLIAERTVHVFCVIDARRNIQSIMNRRFLRVLP
ncbi:MAG: type II toxin-antitoxin system RelE/ParE family toxin [Victivallales bacterium]|jgi:toxin ParE1/3/4